VYAARDEELIISVKEARKLLGKDAKQMSDTEVEKLIIDLNVIARYTIRGIMEGTIKMPSKDTKSYS
jgi:hypothetical protein